jgi:hypothetical protein
MGLGVVSDLEQKEDFPRQNTLSASGGSFELSISRPTEAGDWTVRVGWFEDAGSGAAVSCLADKEFENLAPGHVYTFRPTADQVSIVGGSTAGDAKVVLGWDGVDGA